jgi:hypothetical protein
MGHDHSHHDHPVPRASRRVRLVLACALAPFLVATVVGLAVLWPQGDRPAVSAPEYLDTSTFEDATVTKSDVRECPIAGGMPPAGNPASRTARVSLRP